MLVAIIRYIYNIYIIYIYIYIIYVYIYIYIYICIGIEYACIGFSIKFILVRQFRHVFIAHPFLAVFFKNYPLKHLKESLLKYVNSLVKMVPSPINKITNRGLVGIGCQWLPIIY